MPEIVSAILRADQLQLKQNHIYNIHHINKTKYKDKINKWHH